MRKILNLVFVAALGLAAVGCGGGKAFDGPTVDAFNGKLTAGGKPVSFPPGEEVTLKLFHETGQSFGVPIQSDGSFKIGWMPIGKYSATILRAPKASKSGPNRHAVPGGLVIVDGQTDYTIDLGKGFKS
jgi:hypothetical protein